MYRLQELRGPMLHLAIWVEACFGVMIFGYNQASVGGVLTNLTFNRQFPLMDTISTTGALREQNSRIQGIITGQRAMTE